MEGEERKQVKLHSGVKHAEHWIQPSVFCLNHIKEFFRFSVLGTDRRELVTNNCNDVEVVTHLLAEVQLFIYFLYLLRFICCT